MTDSVYRKTALPVRLNLNDRNTKEQLSAGAPEDNGRGALEGVGPASSTVQSQKGCKDVMRKDLSDWLEKHGITGPPPSAEAEQRAMWQWIRDFHKEYNDDWFARNMPRMLEQFRPLFLEEMKRMKAEIKANAAQADAAANAAAAAAAPAAAKPAAALDLLDFDQPAQKPAEPPAAAVRPQASAGTSDLLSLDGGFDAPMPAPAVAQQQAPAAVYTAPSSGGGLLDLGSFDVVSDPAPAPVSAPAAAGGYSAAPAPTAPAQAAPAKQDAKDPLFDLLM